MLQLSFHKLIRMEQEEEEALLFQPDSAPLPCSHELRNALNVRFPTTWVAVGGTTPSLVAVTKSSPFLTGFVTFRLCI